MVHTDMNGPDVHPVALLLPWYVTGTLSEQERRQADEHLVTCASCRAELAELRVMRTQVREAGADQLVPDMLGAVKARIRQPARHGSTGLLGATASALRLLFAPNWVPAFAFALILVQAGALVWMAQRTPVGGDVSTRGLPSPTTRLSLTFRPTATEQDIRRLLLETHTRIVAGPSVDGIYVVEVPTTDPARIEQRLAVLRGHAEAVLSAERAPP